jgi:hypothetical protein
MDGTEENPTNTSNTYRNKTPSVLNSLQSDRDKHPEHQHSPPFVQSSFISRASDFHSISPAKFSIHNWYRKLVIVCTGTSFVVFNGIRLRLETNALSGSVSEWNKGHRDLTMEQGLQNKNMDVLLGGLSAQIKGQIKGTAAYKLYRKYI